MEKQKSGSIIMIRNKQEILQVGYLVVDLHTKFRSQRQRLTFSDTTLVKGLHCPAMQGAIYGVSAFSFTWQQHKARTYTVQLGIRGLLPSRPAAAPSDSPPGN